MLAGSVGPVAAQTQNPVPVQMLFGIGDLFLDTAADFKQFATKESVAWLTLGLAGASLAHSLDQPTSNGMSRSIGAERVFAAGERMGGARYQLAGALATYTFGRVTGHARVALLGVDLVSANI